MPSPIKILWHARQAARKLRSGIKLFQLKTGMYKKIPLPEYDFNELKKKWPYNNPCCVSDNFHNLPNNPSINLSFIVPLYNSSQFIERLYSQLTSQETNYNYEIIFVDDGSKDDTDKKMRKLIKGMQAKIKYIQQENKRIGGARNTGIDNAEGEYISFVDHDDEVSELFTEKILNDAYNNNADIVKCWHGLKTLGKIVQTELSSGYVMGGVYRRKMFQHVRFPSNEYWYEDMINAFLLKPQAHIAINIPDVLYFKTNHANNASKIFWSAKNYKSIEQIYLVKSLINSYRELGLTDEDYLFDRALNECSGLAVQRTRKLDLDTRKQIFLACHEIISSFPNKPKNLTTKQKIFYDAIMKKDFAAWNMAAVL